MHPTRLTTIALFALLCAGCPRSNPQVMKPTGGSTSPATVTLNGVPDPRLYPAVSGDIATGATMAQIFEGLVVFDEDLMISPGLAESWDSADLETYSFVLRPDLKFSDGSPLTADDVVASFQDFLRNSKDWGWVLEPIQGAAAYRRRESDSLPGVTVTDPRHLTVTLEEKDGLFLHLLALVPAAIYKRTPSSTTVAIGAGPWKVQGRGNAGLILVPNEHHHSFVPKIGQLVIRAGGSDVLEATRYKGSGRIVRYPGLNVEYAYFSPEVPRDVRVVVNHAFDRARFCRSVLANTAVPARGVLPPGMPGHRPDLPDLSEGEIPKLGESYTLRAQLGGQLFDQLKADLAPHGVKLVRATGNKAQLVQYGWIADYPDPDNFLRVLFHSKSGDLNRARYANAKFDELVTSARGMSALLEQGPRLELYQQAEDLILADMPWLFLWHQENVINVTPNLHGLRTCAQDRSGYLELPQTTLEVR